MKNKKESRNQRIILLVEDTFGLVRFPSPLCNGKKYIWASMPQPSLSQLAARGAVISLVLGTIIYCIGGLLVSSQESRIEKCIKDITTEDIGIDPEGLCRQIINNR
jgi:hypothetical protein